MTVLLAQLYWYPLRYRHLMEDGLIKQDPGAAAEGAECVKISGRGMRIVRNGADLLSNRVAFVMTVLASCFLVCWLTGDLLRQSCRRRISKRV